MVPVLELCGGEDGVLGSEGRLPEPACAQELWGKVSLAAERREASGEAELNPEALGNRSRLAEGKPAGAESVSRGLSGGLLGLPFTSAQNKAALCQKRAFPQPHGRPRSPDLAPSSLRPRNPGPHHSPSPGSGVGSQHSSRGESGALRWPPGLHLRLWERILGHRPHRRAGWARGSRRPPGLGRPPGAPIPASESPGGTPARPPAAHPLRGASNSPRSRETLLFSGSRVGCFGGLIWVGARAGTGVGVRTGVLGVHVPGEGRQPPHLLAVGAVEGFTLRQREVVLPVTADPWRERREGGAEAQPERRAPAPRSQHPLSHLLAFAHAVPFARTTVLPLPHPISPFC